MSLRLARRTLLGLFLAGLLFAAWSGFRAYQVQRDLRAAIDDATQLQAAVEAGDRPTSTTALDRLREHGGSAADRTDGLTWRLLTHLPLYGDDARGVQTASDVVSALADDGLGPLTDSARQLDRLAPAGGRVDLATLQSLQGPVRQGSRAFASADRRLGEVDPDGFVGPLRAKYVDLARRIDTVAGQLSAADTALDVMPAMLGADGPRRYLLVVQNNAEIRATGGLPGSVALLSARRGKVRIAQQVPGGALTAPPGRELRISQAEQAIYSTLLGTFFLDANFTPDFPRVADLMRQFWQLRHPGRVDGVVTIDPVTLSYVLGAVGPVTVDGVTLTADNAVDELIHRVYLRLDDPRAQDRFFQDAAQAVFDRLTAGGPSPQALLRALARGVSERRVAIHAFDETLQSELATREVAGALVTDPEAAPQVGFFVNDATGAKMSYYLRYGVTVDATGCQGGRQQLRASAWLRSDAPPDAAKLPDYITGGGAFGTAPGSQLELLRIYGPVGGSIIEMDLDGRPLEFERHTQDGRTVAVVVVQLDPGQRADLTWSMTTGEDQRGAVDVDVTPGVEPGTKSSEATSACS